MNITINSATELFSIGVDINKPLDGDYILGQDIDCSEINNPLPIGESVEIAFAGTLDGNIHTIKNLTMNHSDSDNFLYLGLFYMLGEGSEIKNLNFDACNVTSNKNTPSVCVGLLAGYCKPDDTTTNPVKITNCHATNCSVTAMYNTGGLMGVVDANINSVLRTTVAQLTNCSFEGEVKLKSYYAVSAGGLISGAYRTEFEKCYFIGDISDNGGLVNGDFGGLVGQAYHMISMVNCFARTHFNLLLDDYNEKAGGLICRNYCGEYTTLKNCYSAETWGFIPNNTSLHGGLIYFFPNVNNPSDYVTDCHWDRQTAGTTFDASGVEGQTSLVMQIKDTYKNWDFDKTWGIKDSQYPDFNAIAIVAGIIHILEKPKYFDLDMSMETNIYNDIIIKNDKEAIEQSIIDILFTRIGEREEMPTYGSILFQTLMEKMSHLTTIQIKENVLSAIQNWEPRVKVLSVNVEPNQETYTYNISIKVNIIRLNVETEYNIILEKIK